MHKCGGKKMYGSKKTGKILKKTNPKKNVKKTKTKKTTRYKYK